MSSPHPASITWNAIKNGSTPVTGTIEGSAISKLGAAGLKGTGFTMTFSSSSIDSGNETRDGRIANLFFRVSDFGEASYKPVIDYVEGSDTSIPAPGESRKIEMTGPLTISGQTVQSRVKATVENDGKELTVTDSGENKIDVMATKLLNSNVVDLLKVAGVDSMERQVSITGKMILTRECD
jgi:polyisoprenoid-binding protein YceI